MENKKKTYLHIISVSCQNCKQLIGTIEIQTESLIRPKFLIKYKNFPKFSRKADKTQQLINELANNMKCNCNIQLQTILDI
jgi:flagellin-specific chaperone FliS